MKTDYRTLREGEVLRPGDEIHPLTVMPAFATDDQWRPLKDNTLLIKGTVGRRCFGIPLPEGGFRRPVESQSE